MIYALEFVLLAAQAASPSLSNHRARNDCWQARGTCPGTRFLWRAYDGLAVLCRKQGNREMKEHHIQELHRLQETPGAPERRRLLSN